MDIRLGDVVQVTTWKGAQWTGRVELISSKDVESYWQPRYDRVLAIDLETGKRRSVYPADTMVKEAV